MWCGLKKPKADKKQHRKPLRRGKKKIATRSAFKEWGRNSTKTYRRRFSDYQVMVRAEISRQERLRNPTQAEEAFAEMLVRLGIKPEREKIILNGDRWVLIDFYIPSVHLAIELDGSAHDNQKQYDHQRSEWLARKHGMHVVRFTNREVFSGKAEERIRQMLGINPSSPENP